MNEALVNAGTELLQTARAEIASVVLRDAPALNPHTWRRFDLAQQNMIRFFKGGRKRKRDRLAARKWAIEMQRWMNRLDREFFN